MAITKQWKKGIGEIAFIGKKISIDVYRHVDYPGVIIHRNYSHNGQLLGKWSISHELSGIRLHSTDVSYNSLSKAIMAFLKHAAGVSWDRPVSEIVKDPEAKKAWQAMSEAGVKR